MEANMGSNEFNNFDGRFYQGPQDWKERRQKIYIYPRFQFIFITLSIFSSSLLIGTAYGLQHFLGWNPVFSWSVSATVFLALQAFISFRMAGPLYKLFLYMLQTKTSDNQNIQFRKGDFFQELAAAYNTMLENLKTENQPPLEELPGNVYLIRPKVNDSDKKAA